MASEVTVIDRLGRANLYGGDGGHWFTDLMLTGAETVEEHLLAAHSVSEAELAVLSFDERHALHDSLHEQAGDGGLIALMEILGFE